MSVVLAVILFLVGSGLVWLGAFFLWRFSGNVMASIVQNAAMVLCALINHNPEIVVGLIWGTVLVNLFMLAIVALRLRVCASKKTCLVAGLWSVLGWLVCLVGIKTGIGHFGGIGLLIVGVVVLGQMFLFTKDKDLELKKIKWWWLCVASIVSISGIWLMLWQSTTVTALLGMPTSIFSLLVLAPMIAFSALLGLQHSQRLVVELLQSNALLVTVGLGLTALCFGSLHITQSMAVVMLPWVGVMVGLMVVNGYLPQKTARWWGGLMIMLGLGCYISLLW